MAELVWGIDVHDRIGDLTHQTMVVKRDLGCAVHAFCNHLGFAGHIAGPDKIYTGENTGHHGGPWDASVAFLASVTGDTRYVVRSHADVTFLGLPRFWELARAKLDSGFQALVLTGGPDGAMGSSSDFGFFGDFYVMTAEAYASCFSGEIPGKDRWYETNLADRFYKALGKGKVYEIPFDPPPPKRSHDEIHTFPRLFGENGVHATAREGLTNRLSWLEKNR